ncbi:LacI family DNA-binding transcriptional regulator [Thalassotalea sp. PP2-459]|uniref:LacI family DNA-binding transcriptional regulator n=1 Tax=Thalassotalea sp. PP2-459 TaxID=1742724 RepID=UPI000943213C|nr:LacI family DNA-binding transcriptional regulator [Thalassotalea sp. PP2-459]OKY25259.1 LacI family transcriptional regulator [Thalassotalea sp. PP2-459]
MTDKKVWTLKSVAKELGVSNATVSNAFNRPDQLSKVRRENILASCEKLGYSGPNKAAQSLRKGQFNIVALVLPDSVEYMITDPVASKFVKGVSSVLEKSKVNLLLFSGSSDNINAVSDFVDGFICYGRPRNAKLINQLKTTSKKVVTADFDIERSASVGIDNEQAAYEVAKLAINSKDDSIAILGLRLLDSDVTCRVYDLPNTNFQGSVTHQRLNGYKRAIKELSVDLRPDRVWNIPKSTHQTALNAVREALTSNPRPNVLLCMSDLIALAAIKEINSMGLTIPDDIRITGFDGIDEALRSNPTITTVHQNSEKKGTKAAELFINRATDSVIIPFHIEHGRSC